MTVEGTKRMGKTIPETTPNNFKASFSDKPARMSITGNKTATAELTREPLARTAVMGIEDFKRGFSVPFGEEILPPRIKNQTRERLQEKR